MKQQEERKGARYGRGSEERGEREEETLQQRKEGGKAELQKGE